MRKDVGAFAALLLASGAAWGIVRLRSDPAVPEDAPDRGAEAPRDSGESERPLLSGLGAIRAAHPSPTEEPPSAPGDSEPAAAGPSVAHERAARPEPLPGTADQLKQLEGFKDDALAFGDPARREQGFAGIGRALDSGNSYVVSAAISALHAIAEQSDHRVEGALADLFLKALHLRIVSRDGTEVANDLRFMWVTPEVEDAFLAAWQARPDPSRVGLWYHILGQVRPTREPRVRALFEILAKGESNAVQLFDQALGRNLDPSVAPLAAQLALDALSKAPNDDARRLYVNILRDHGTRAQRDGLRAFASDPTVTAHLRREASSVADALDGR
jgi:hypothetical protein